MVACILQAKAWISTGFMFSPYRRLLSPRQAWTAKAAIRRGDCSANTIAMDMFTPLIRLVLQVDHHNNYQMLPSKSNDPVHAVHSPDSSLHDHDDAHSGQDYEDNTALKGKIVTDLKPSFHRNT
jgi:hypothetical protein